MNAERVATSLRQILKIYNTILDDSASSVIPQAIASLKASTKRYEEAKQGSSPSLMERTWGYTIHHDEPLRFKVSPIRDVELSVDVYCDIRWAAQDTPINQDIKVRIWSTHDDTIFLEHRDARHVCKRLTDPGRDYHGRVVSRFHFDRVNSDQGKTLEYHPEYHLQFGGKSEEYELCWHPKKVNIPRLSFPPMELFLTCQMIAANFFWEDYLDIRERSEYQAELIMYQNLLLSSYYEDCLQAVRNNESVLDKLSTD